MNTNTATPRRHVGLRIPPDALAAIDALAEQHGLTRTEYVIRACTGELTDPTNLSAELDTIDRRLGRLEQLAYGT